MTPALDAAQTLASCAAILLLHGLFYYVFTACAAPVYIPQHDTPLAPLAEAQP